LFTGLIVGPVTGFKGSYSECCYTHTLRRSFLNSRHRRFLHRNYIVCLTMRSVRLQDLSDFWLRPTSDIGC